MSSLAATTLQEPSRWRRMFRWWFAVEPMRHAWWETVVMRSVIAWAVLLTLWEPARQTSQPQPHGLAAWGADFTWLADAELHPTLRLVWIAGLALYVAGIVPVFTLLPPLIASIGLGVLGNSSGSIGHTTQVLTVVLLAQWMAYAWASLQPRTRLPMPNGFDRHQLAADWARQAFAATYVVSAIKKLIESRGDWISDTPYFGLQVAKSMGMGFQDYLAPRIDAQTAWLSQWFVDHPLAATIILGAALPLELLAFLALNNRRIALVFGLALYAFHSSVTEIMQLGFLYHKILLLALFINPVWWVVEGGRRWLPMPVKKVRMTKSE